VLVGVEEGLKHESSIHCDELVSLPKTALTNYIGMLSPEKLEALNKALLVALEIQD
jgi:mRNA interferase MazF